MDTLLMDTVIINAVINFLSFKIFITPSLLIYFYFFGAVLIPFMGWVSILKLKKKYTLFAQGIKQSLAPLMHPSQLKHRLIIYTTLVFIFVILELIWRAMFEFLIAYFQMHDALIKMVNG